MKYVLCHCSVVHCYPCCRHDRVAIVVVAIVVVAVASVAVAVVGVIVAVDVVVGVAVVVLVVVVVVVIVVDILKKTLGSSICRILCLTRILGSSICRSVRVLESSRMFTLWYFTCLGGSGKLNVLYSIRCAPARRPS